MVSSSRELSQSTTAATPKSAALNGPMWSFDGANILRHSEAGAIIYHPRVARDLLVRFERDGPWAAEHARQLRAALEAADPTEDALWSARQMEHA